MAATAHSLPPDPLLLLRQSIAANTLPVPATHPDPSNQAQSDVSIADASHLIFNSHAQQDGPQHIAVPLTQHTRFTSGSGRPLDLRSIYLAWHNRDKAIAEYLSAISSTNEELKAAGKSETVTNLVFAERLDIRAWLAGEIGVNDSEYIKSLDDNKQLRAEAEDAAEKAAGDADVEMRDIASDESRRREEEERLHLIYAAERKMGNHNTVLRGSKTQDFSGIRKYSALFLGKQKPTAQAPALNNNPAMRPSVKPSQQGRRPEPIILLSSSFSSLIRMPNIKSFLAEGTYTPLEASGEAANILHITRNLRTIHPGHATRFILVDDPLHFRPDYWNRVVAVFTTGQTWQFKNYKWQNPAELFSHALGVYVGWKGEVVPDTVKGWGRGVLSVQIDKGSNRWRDREVVEDIWSQIEARMRAMGWGKDAQR
ncbi:Cell division control protein 73 [Fulvia fulva]|uniref:Cell division control protein 73 n=1 Tax=Passalora fulva TaxID=5499 RepID=A0A9Q8LD95_PASFU|nr:Cell division control protein 73 [Fulvia fulva]KAK4629343.1 Cell division control protein 73 [Fulvia fulva]KAK4630189.1 Cell division control protein 73 [Fulvia fulva]UJO15281.1 Cell division control protein 73 [Fulvia fulva]WPV12805.1 Cell division control protein 73 [Fulvia fulva]WPV27781.1 Cell division control protein 73 [Fulvia fulva]